MLELRPVAVRAACDVWVPKFHRHLKRVVGGLFAATVFVDDALVGVAIASFPKAQEANDGFTVEITRVATDGHPNACSRLYGALCRASASIGHRLAITYTRLDEPGTSLRAAGFVQDGLTRAENWDRDARPRKRDEEPEQKVRWIRRLQEPKAARLIARRSA